MVNYCITLESFIPFQILPDSPGSTPGVSVFLATSVQHLHLQRSSYQLQAPHFSIVSRISNVKLSSLMHLIFITADHKDATIVQKQSYQRKKSEYYPSSL